MFTFTMLCWIWTSALADSIMQRPTEVTLILSNSRGAAGTYQATQVSRMCGEVAPEMSMTGERVLLVEFPDEGDLEITNVSFASKTLVAGVASTDKFNLSIGVKAKLGGQPSYLLDTTRSKNTGTATVSVAAGILRLKVVGANDMGERIDLTVVCHPAKG